MEVINKFQIITFFVIGGLMSNCNSRKDDNAKLIDKSDTSNSIPLKLVHDFDKVTDSLESISIYIIDSTSNDNANWKSIIYDSNKISKSYKKVAVLNKNTGFELLNIMTAKTSYGHPETFGFDPSFAGIVYDKNHIAIAYFIIDLYGRSVSAKPLILQQELFRRIVDGEPTGNTLLSDIGIKRLKSFLKKSDLLKYIPINLAQ